MWVLKGKGLRFQHNLEFKIISLLLLKTKYYHCKLGAFIKFKKFSARSNFICDGERNDFHTTPNSEMLG